jgi:hypothetical protein
MKISFLSGCSTVCLGLSAQDVKKIRNAYDKRIGQKQKRQLACFRMKRTKELGSWYKGLIWPDCQRCQHNSSMRSCNRSIYQKAMNDKTG